MRLGTRHRTNHCGGEAASADEGEFAVQESGVARIHEFVWKQKCVPWRVRNKWITFREGWMRRHLTDIYRVVKFGRRNVNTRSHWDGIWAEEADSPTRQGDVLFEEVSRRVREGAKVLDAGCGVGNLLGYLKEARNADVYGVDISSRGIGTASKKGIQGAVGCLPDLPLADNCMDVVIATEVLEHLSAPRKAVREMVRILRPGGLLILSVPDDNLHPEEEIEHMHSFDKETMRRLVSPYADVIEAATVPYGHVADHPCLIVVSRKGGA